MASKQNALKDAMERAKQIAAKLKEQKASAGDEEGDSQPAEGTRKRVSKWEPAEDVKPDIKKISALAGFTGMTDPKLLAQQVAANLVAKAGMGFELVEEVTIPNNLVGLVIGRGGEMINKLQSDSGAKVQVAPDPAPGTAGGDAERKVTISGSTQSVEKAKGLLDEIKRNKKIPERLMVGTKPGEFTIEMNIANGKVGLIIGKGGETIKSLQERASCKMVLFQDGSYANASEKPLRITGEQNAVMYGKQLVSDLLTSKEIEAATTSNYKELKVPKDAVGMIIGAKGANIQQIQADTGCRLQFKNDDNKDEEMKTAVLTGTPQELHACETKIMELINQSAERKGGRRSNWGPPQSNGADGMQEMLIEVPAGKCGMVIGRGGETIRMIHQESQATIDVNRDIDRNAPTRTFRVKGTEDMIRKALHIIRDKTGDSSLTARPEGGGPPLRDRDEDRHRDRDRDHRSDRDRDYRGDRDRDHRGDRFSRDESRSRSRWDPPRSRDEPQAPWNQRGGPPDRSDGGNRPPWDTMYPTTYPQQQSWTAQPPQQSPWGAPTSYPQQYPPHQQPPAQQQPQQQQPQQQSTPSTSEAQTPQSGATDASGKRDYSAEWAAYYEQQRQQQQQQQYRQYGQQPPPAQQQAPASSQPYQVGQYEGYQQTPAQPAQPQQPPQQSQPQQPYGQQQHPYYSQPTNQGYYGYGQQQPPQQPTPQQPQPPASSAANGTVDTSKPVDDYQSKLQDFYKSLR